MQKSDLEENHLQRLNVAIKLGLQSDEWELVSEITGGKSSAKIYKIIVNNIAYAIKLDEIVRQQFNLNRCYYNLQIVSDAKIAPTVHYLNAEMGVVIMDYIPSLPFKVTNKEQILEFANTLRKLHDGKPFQSEMSLLDIFNFLYKILPDEIKSHQLIVDSLSYVQRMREVISDTNDIKPSHGDLNPSNILYDGKHLYFVDWLAAMPQNFYFDLSCCQLFFYFHNDKLANQFIEYYFKRCATDNELMKLSIIKKFTLIYYGIVFLSFPIMLGKMQPPLSDQQIQSLPSFIECMQQIVTGQINLSDPKIQQQCGFIFLQHAKEQEAN